MSLHRINDTRGIAQRMGLGKAIFEVLDSFPKGIYLKFEKT